MKKKTLKLIDKNIDQISFQFNKKIKISLIQIKTEKTF